jgi:hypothetical protein
MKKKRKKKKKRENDKIRLEHSSNFANVFLPSGQVCHFRDLRGNCAIQLIDSNMPLEG